jgi:lipopolysaccharide/colanic/teichoic acid biosynthesis glycosyltransferase
LQFAKARYQFKLFCLTVPYQLDALLLILRKLPMTSSVISNLDDCYTVSQEHQQSNAPYCTLKWRQGQLLVKPLESAKQPYLASLDNEQHLVECLKHSPVNIVRIDPKLGEERLIFWANACLQASKPIYLHIPTGKKLPKFKALPLKLLRRLIDFTIAFALLLVTSPLMLALALLLMRFYSPEEILEQQWHVGERGRLFRTLRFRTTLGGDKTAVNKVTGYKNSGRDRNNNHKITPLGCFMRKYGLQNLPLLLNVLRGEMSLTGPRCWTLAEAVRLSFENQRQLNELPGITGSWQLQTETKLLQLDGQAL